MANDNRILFIMGAQIISKFGKLNTFLASYFNEFIQLTTELISRDIRKALLSRVKIFVARNIVKFGSFRPIRVFNEIRVGDLSTHRTRRIRPFFNFIS